MCSWCTFVWKQFRRRDFLKCSLLTEAGRRITSAMKRGRGGARGARGKGGDILRGVVVCSTGVTKDVKVSSFFAQAPRTPAETVGSPSHQASRKLGQHDQTRPARSHPRRDPFNHTLATAVVKTSPPAFFRMHVSLSLLLTIWCILALSLFYPQAPLALQPPPRISLLFLRTTPSPHV